ncbi:MAG: hypothetical protein AAFY88_17420, partial [Acidobacteriota bacterium]
MARSRQTKRGKKKGDSAKGATPVERTGGERENASTSSKPPKPAKKTPTFELPVFDLVTRERMRLTFKQRHLLRKALWALAALGLPALFWVWRPGFPMVEDAEVPVKTVFAVSIFALVLAREFTPNLRRGKAGAALLVAAVLGAAIYFNLGAFHGRAVTHYWEQFHYTLGAKYFPELGYDGLYAASIEAQLAVYPNHPVQPKIRDLRTNAIVQTQAPETLAHRKEVRERFSAERWRDFVGDHKHFLQANNRGYIGGIRRDHGFNPPPSWTFMARLFAGWMPLNRDSLTSL